MKIFSVQEACGEVCCAFFVTGSCTLREYEDEFFAKVLRGIFGSKEEVEFEGPRKLKN
jgi:hypothetical protein